jgi:hypothetical protein
MLAVRLNSNCQTYSTAEPRTRESGGRHRACWEGAPTKRCAPAGWSGRKRRSTRGSEGVPDTKSSWTALTAGSLRRAGQSLSSVSIRARISQTTSGASDGLNTRSARWTRLSGRATVSCCQLEASGVPAPGRRLAVPGKTGSPCPQNQVSGPRGFRRAAGKMWTSLENGPNRAGWACLVRKE